VVEIAGERRTVQKRKGVKLPHSNKSAVFRARRLIPRNLDEIAGLFLFPKLFD